MKERISFHETSQHQSVLVKSLLDIGAATSQALEHSLIYLVKIRASQLNNCAFCLHLNINDARKNGEKQARLDVLSAWKEVPAFSSREKAALDWTEKLTLLSSVDIHDDDFSQLHQEFTREEIVNLTAVIVAINAWNRISIGFHYIPDIQS